MKFRINHSVSATILVLVVIVLSLWSGSALAADDNMKDYEHDSFDAASFYDRKAPNERSEDYLAEKKKDHARSGLPIDETRTRTSTSLVHGTREEQIMILEDDLHRLRRGELAMAMNRVNSAESALHVAKQNMGWFPSSEDRERIVLLEKTAERHRKELVAVQRDEKALELKLKPLYGIVSKQFWDEQRRAISSSIDTVHKMAADQTWWSTLFKVGEVQKIEDLIMHAIMEYFVMSILCYSFGVLFFALWTSPWAVYEYSRSIVDMVLLGVPSYIASVILMLIPLLCFVGLLVGIVRFLALREQGGWRGRDRGGGRAENGTPSATEPRAVPAAGADPAARDNLRRETERAQHAANQQRRYAPSGPSPASAGADNGGDGIRFRGVGGGGFGGAPVNDID